MIKKTFRSSCHNDFENDLPVMDPTSTNSTPSESERLMGEEELIDDETSLIQDSFNNDNGSIESDTKKSYFVLHVGPPKTATTTLQLQLLNLTDILRERDDVLYFHADRNPVPLIATLHTSNCHVQLKEVRQAQKQSNATTLQLRDALNRVTCWKPFLQEIQEYRQNYADTTSFMYSSEGFGIGWTRPTDWISLRETLASVDIELVVVITYRRYYEWLLSSKQHAEKWTGAKKFLTQWPNQGGQHTLDLLPTVLHFTSGKSKWFPFQYTDAMIDMIAPHVPQTRLLNLHEDKSVLSTYLCDVLPNTPETCKYSLEKDATDAAEFRANTQDSFRDESKGMKQTITAYDRIAMEAARQGLLNMTLITRRFAGLKCRNFHQVVLNGTEKDLPLTCPSQSLLHAFLNESLAKEEAIMPDFYRKHQDKHWASFWKAAVANKFCMVNATAVLMDTRWRLCADLGYEAG